MKNKPYIKEFDEQGLLTNPITEYISEFPNRRSRRAYLQKSRFHGQSKNFHLTVKGSFRYHRVLQEIKLKDGSVRRVEHYKPLGKLSH